MSVGQWLNSLTAVDHFIILGFFALACIFSWFTLNGLRQLYGNLHGQNRYVHEFRITPFPFLGIAILYTVIMYMLLGDLFITFFSSLPAG